LGGRTALEAVPEIETSAPPSLRHVFTSDAAGPRTATRVRPHYEGSATVEATLSSQTPAAASPADLKLGKIELSFAPEPANDASIALKTDKGEIGAIIGRREGPTHVAMSWRQAKIEEGLHGGERAAAANGLVHEQHLGALQHPSARALIF